MNALRNFPRILNRTVANPLTALSLMLAVAACSGSDGSTGPVGPPGPSEPTSTEVEQGKNTPGIHLTIVSLGGATGAGGKFAVGNHLAVTFTLTKDDGTVWNISEMDYARVLVSGPSFNYQRVLPEVTDVATASVQNDDGSYTYTFADAIPATYAAPYNKPASSGTADGELTGQTLLAGTYTVGAYVGWNYTVDNEDFRDADDATQDFLFGDTPALDTREVVGQDNCNVCHTGLRVHGDLRRDVKLCVLCHTAGSEDKNDETDTLTPGVSIDFKVMIHRIHNGGHLPSVLGVTTNNDGSRNYAAAPAPYELVGYMDSVTDFSEVNFPVWPNLNVALPKDTGYSLLSSTDPDGSGPLLSPRTRDDTTRTGVTACAKCHGDPDAAGPLSAPAQGQMYKDQPTEQSCGSCHDDVRWGHPYTANGQTMPNTADNSNCLGCHPSSGGSLATEDAHVHPLLDAAIDPGVNSVITAVTGGSGISGANGQNFLIGDTPTLTFTLKDDANADVGLASMDSCSAFFFGPTTNRQLVMPFTSPNGMSLNPFDFTGRLQAVSTSNKGTLSKVFLGSTAVKETLVVQLTSATAFSVTGTVSGSLGTGALPTTPTTNSTNPSGSSVSAFELGSSLGSGTVQITFSDATNFTVVATPGGTLGTGVLPASTSASTRFTSPTFSFNISVGTTVFAAGNTINIGLFRGSAANPVLFAVVAGRTAFSAAAGAADRFYYEVVPNSATYTVKMPMDMAFEFLADSTATAAQVLPAAGNLPVYYGRQQLWEAAASATTTSSTTAGTALGRQVDIASTIGFANGDTVVIEPASGIGVREYLQVAPARADGVIAAATDATVRLYFKTPLRYAHPSGSTITKVTLAFKQEGAANAYTLDSATGVITSTAAFTASRGLVLSYRTDARFGYRRHSGDAVQALYVPPANDSIDIDQEQGEWKGLPYLDGTYTADIWFYKNIDLGRWNELQTYRSASNAGTLDFLYGTATEIVPHAIISASDNCYTCHNDVIFHGGGRRGVDACLTCHSISGCEDKPRWDTPKVGTTTTDTALTTGVPIEFRQMLHKIHKGVELANASTYTVVGNGGNPSTYGEVEFPAMPGGVRQCIRCHGNDAWKAPADRSHPSASVPVHTWGVVCGSCHDSDDAHAHITAQTTGAGQESCSVCHGSGKDFSVEVAHKAY